MGKVSERADCLELLFFTKYQTFRDPLDRIAHITSLEDLSGAKQIVLKLLKEFCFEKVLKSLQEILESL